MSLWLRNSQNTVKSFPGDYFTGEKCYSRKLLKVGSMDYPEYAVSQSRERPKKLSFTPIVLERQQKIFETELLKPGGNVTKTIHMATEEENEKL